MLRSGGGAFRRRAVGAHAPEDHLGLIDCETLVRDRGKAGPCPDYAVDILGAAAPPADHVVMVIPDAALETS
jgi:hypothetical protein